MQFEVGNIVEGKVTGITKFGAFVELPGGKTGMVHISEVAATYVKEISDHLELNQMVQVKVLSISDDGKISLSIKKCQEVPSQPTQNKRPSQWENRPREARPRENRPPQNRGWQPKKVQPMESMSFEDMLTKFKQTSDDKMMDLKRNSGDTRRARKSSPR